jgi:hypothetical protein
MAAPYNQPIDHEWRAELLERAPRIVAQTKNSTERWKRFAHDWWRAQYIAEFGCEPLFTANTGRS